jgi:hypothetical protein
LLVIRIFVDIESEIPRFLRMRENDADDVSVFGSKKFTQTDLHMDLIFFVLASTLDVE